MVPGAVGQGVGQVQSLPRVFPTFFNPFPRSSGLKQLGARGLERDGPFGLCPGRGSPPPAGGCGQLRDAAGPHPRPRAALGTIFSQGERAAPAGMRRWEFLQEEPAPGLFGLSPTQRRGRGPARPARPGNLAAVRAGAGRPRPGAGPARCLDSFYGLCVRVTGRKGTGRRQPETKDRDGRATEEEGTGGPWTRDGTGARTTVRSTADETGARARRLGSDVGT